MLNLPAIDWSPDIPALAAAANDACGVYAFAQWAMAARNITITPTEARVAWESVLHRNGGQSPDGLTVPQAFFAAHEASWIPTGATIRRVSSMDRLKYGPLLVAVRVTSAWYSADEDGRFPVFAGQPMDSHVICVTGHSSGYYRFPNCWGPQWGDNGYGVIDAEDLRECTISIWQMVMPGQPNSDAEADEKDTADLADSIADQVVSIHLNLRELGYQGLPGDSRILIPDVMARSMARQLSPDQERAKNNIASVFLLLRQEGITDDDINNVFAHLKAAGAITNTGGA